MAQQMRAAVVSRYGPPESVRLEQVPRPDPKAGEILVRVHSTSVTSADWRVRSLSLPPGFGPLGRLVLWWNGPRQRILGTEASGVVEAVGAGVTRWRAGDAVIVFSGFRMGCHAEFVVVAEDGPVAAKPTDFSHDEAVGLSFGGATALHYLQKAGVGPGRRVLINGASGGVGTAAVQLARYFGAEVTGVCSGANVGLVRGLGADDVIDYTRADFAAAGREYDIILDVVGTAPYERVRGCLARGGVLVLILAGLGQLLAAPLQSLRSGHRVMAGPAEERPEYIRTLAHLAEEGHLRPVIDRRFAFDQIADAHRLVESGRKRGNVVVVVRGS